MIPDIKIERVPPEYLANVIYNQRPREAASFESGRRGLADSVEKMKQSVEAGHYALDPQTRARILKMDAVEVAGFLCNSVQRYLHLRLNELVVGNFEQFYISGIQNGAYKWQNGWNMYALIKNERRLMETYLTYGHESDKYPLDYVEYKRGRYLLKHHEKSRHKYSSLDMVEGFHNSNVKYCLVRNGKNTHTYGAYKNGPDSLCFDTYHNDWTGRSLYDRAKQEGIKYLYWYL